jgi:hypothetical protein
VYGAITLYLANRAEIDAYLTETEKLWEEARKNQSPIPPALRERLERARRQLNKLATKGLAMADILFILPDKNGLETPFGDQFRLSCRETDSVTALFDAIRQRLGEGNVRLSLEAPKGEAMALMAIDPHTDETVGSAGLAGARIIVGFQRA